MLARLQCEWSVGVASWLHECWHGFSANEVLTLLHGKDGCQHGFSANMKCWCNFMTKIDVGTTLVQMKCWCGFMAKTSISMTLVLIWSVDVTSWRRWMLAWLQCKYRCDFITNASASIASRQKWMLAWLQYKDKCWHGFMVKTLDVATLQRLLKWLRWKDKCWCSLIAKESPLRNKNKQQQRTCQKKISWHVLIIKNKKNKKREKALILICSLSKKKKKKGHNFSTYHTTHLRLLVQISACSGWLYIENFFGNKQNEKGELASP